MASRHAAFGFILWMNGVALLFFSLLPRTVKSQDPAYFRFGQDVFNGVQIYDVIQDNSLDYWFATNEGLYVYDYHSFLKVEMPGAKSVSLFNFVRDDHGVIYAHNLNNQVFQIKEGKCRVFHELEVGSSDLSLGVANGNQLLIGGKGAVALDTSGKVIARHEPVMKYLGPAFQRDDKSVQFHIRGRDSILVYASGRFHSEKMGLEPEFIHADMVLRFFRNEGSLYAVDMNHRTWCRYEESIARWKSLPPNPVFSKGNAIRIYDTRDAVWVTGSLPGVAMLSSRLGSEYRFQDQFISDIYQDQEGNHLVSTFDHGVFVVPDLEVRGPDAGFADDPVTALLSDPILGLIVGTSKGNIYRKEAEVFSKINKEGAHSIQVLASDSASRYVLYDDGWVRLHDKFNGRTTDLLNASLKDAVFLSSDEVLLGTNRGIYGCSLKGEFAIENFREFKSRVYAVEYDKASQTVYASTSLGLFAWGPGGIQKQVQYHDRDLFPADMQFQGGKLYLLDQTGKILVLQGYAVVDSILPQVNGEAKPLKEMRIWEGSIFGSAGTGLYQFDLQGNCLKSLHTFFGFSGSRVNAFTFHGNGLWVSHAEGLQQLDLHQAAHQMLKPVIRLDRILVNDKPVSPNMPGYFGPDQRKVQVFFSSPTLQLRETLRYHSKLEGYDLEWMQQSDPADHLDYNALAPGHYTLRLKAERMGVFSDEISWSFSIRRPFYASGWFITLVVILFLLGVYALYRWQISIQRRKSRQANELNASKLSAIQSQMNPHFIFNSLNSIQDLILKGDVEHSYSYITTFSNLVRRTLLYSEKDFIEFEEEVELLELYLSLEKLRFRKDFHYEIVVSEKVQDILIPPLLVQPFIENALVHGLLHKAGEKRLKVSFDLEEVLICVIEDNGIGRGQARSIRERQRAEHESFSGKAIRKRMEILSDIYQGDFGYRYEDLQENGVATGTRVILRIPVRMKF